MLGACQPRLHFPSTNHRAKRVSRYQLLLCNLRARARFPGYPFSTRGQRTRRAVVVYQAGWETALLVFGPPLGSAFLLEAKIAKRCTLSRPGWFQEPQRLQLRHPSWIDERNLAEPELRHVFTWTTARRPPSMQHDLSPCPLLPPAAGSRKRREAFGGPNGVLSRMV